MLEFLESLLLAGHEIMGAARPIPLNGMCWCSCLIGTLVYPKLIDVCEGRIVSFTKEIAVREINSDARPGSTVHARMAEGLVQGAILL